jgi:hypothetical protein
MTKAEGGSPSSGEHDVSTGGNDAVVGSADRTPTTRSGPVNENAREKAAETVFDELKTESDADDTGLYEDVSPEAIVDAADGHEYERYTDGGDAITAGEAVNSLLLPERSDGEEFRWVETDSADSPADQSDDPSDDTVPFGERNDLFAAPETPDVADSTTDGDAGDGHEAVSDDDDSVDGVFARIRSLFDRL